MEGSESGETNLGHSHNLRSKVIFALNQDLQDLENQVTRYERIDQRVSTLLEIIHSGAPYAGLGASAQPFLG